MNGRTPPHVKIRPVAGWQSLDLAQVWQFRDLLLAFAGRDLKLRYRQTALGAAWVVVQPLIAAGIFSFVFGKIAKLDADGVPVSIFLRRPAGVECLQRHSRQGRGKPCAECRPDL